MSGSKRQARDVEAVARHFCAQWESRKEDPGRACLTIDGKRIAVDVARLARKGRARKQGPARPRLRFDRVALGFVRRLRAALADSVPEGRTILITVTAPIRSASRTATALAEVIREGLTRGKGRLQIKKTMEGNQVGARLVQDLSGRASKVVGFVHNPDLDSDILLSLAESMLRHVGARAAGCAPETAAGDRWLMLACDDPSSYLEIYRHVHAQLAIPTDFAKIVLVFADGRVDALKPHGRA